MDLGFGQQNQQMGNQALEAVGMIAEMQENMLDAEIHKLVNLDGKDLAKIREERVKQLKERKLEEAEWSRHGHGHLAKMASLHRETRFCTFDAEKSPYLCDKILADPDGNVVIPTLLLVKEGKVTYHIRGLAELGGEQCNCEIMAAVLQIHGLIEGEAAKHEYDDGQPTYGSVE